MDITNGWDFRLQRHRDAALKYIREAKPKLVIGSLECRLSSPLQNLTKHVEKSDEQQMQQVEALEHTQFVVKISIQNRPQTEGCSYTNTQHKPRHGILMR